MPSLFNSRVVWLVIFIVSVLVVMNFPHNTAESAAESQPLTEFLNKDGTLNLSTDFAGTVDMAGYRMELRADGTPLFVAPDQNNTLATSLPEEVYWDNQFALPNGTFGSVHTMVADGKGGIYVGGRFETMGNQVASNIAKWDQQTETWSVLAANGVEGVRHLEEGRITSVNILVWDNETQSLFVGGAFDHAGGIETKNVARWDASINRWAAVGVEPNAGTDAPVLALAWNEVEQILYAGGEFQTAGEEGAPYIAKWVKATNNWLPVGDVIDQNVRVLEWRNSENMLYVAGEFGRVATWNEQTDVWGFLGDEGDLINGTVFDLVWVESTGLLYVGGSFPRIGGMNVNNIAQWNEATNSWSRLGGGLNISMSSMVWEPEASALYAAGTTQNKAALYRWDTLYNRWDTITRDSVVSNSSVYHELLWDSTEGDLLVGGFYRNIESASIYGIGLWDASTMVWAPMGQTIGQGIFHDTGHMVLDGQAGVFVQGRFNDTNLWHWNPQTNAWTSLGETPFDIKDLAFDRETGTLFAAWVRYRNSQPPISQVARWDPKPQTWIVINSFYNGDFFVTALSLLWEEQRDVLYIGTLNDHYGSNVFKWDSKTDILEVLPNTPVATYSIYSMAWDEEHEVLYVGGQLENNGILKYHETTDTWETLGAGVSGTVHKMAWNDHDNSLYTFGNFTSAGGQPTNGFAKWEEDSDEWSLFGTGADLWVSDLVWDSYQSRLYLGGIFTIQDASLPLVWWDELTDRWGWYSNNPRGAVLNIAYEPSETNDGEFWVTGNFEVAGDVAAHQLTRRLLTPLPTPTPTSTLPPTLTPVPTYTPTATLPPTSTATATPTSVPTTTVAPLFLPLIQKRTVESAAESQPLTEFLNEDGTINLTTDFAGTVDMAGYRMEFRADGTPLFVAPDQNNTSATSLPEEVYWDNQFALPNGTFGSVHTMVADGKGGIYVGGRFETMGNQVASNIAKWDQHTQSWSVLAANGVEGVRHLEEGRITSVNILAWDNETQSLFVGGAFDHAGGIETKNVARWDASINRWAAVGIAPNAGTDAPVLALAWNEVEQILYAGGEFQTAGGEGAPFIAKWVKATNNWLPVGNMIDKRVYVLEWRSSEKMLYAAGEFGRVATWNEQTDVWGFLGDEEDLINGTVIDIEWAESTGILYIGGIFQKIGGMNVHNIAQWNEQENSWSRMSGGLNMFIGSIEWNPETSVLYVGGSMHNKAVLMRWNNENVSWQTIKKDYVGNITSIYHELLWDSTESDLFVGGAYRYIDTISTHGIALWDAATLAWEPLERNTGQGTVHDIDHIVLDGQGGLFIKGRFKDRYIAHWNPQTNAWTSLATSPHDVRELAFDRETGTLFVSWVEHNFPNPSGAKVVRWDPKLQTWDVIGSFSYDYREVVAFSLLWEEKSDVLYIGTSNFFGTNVFKWDSKTDTLESLPASPIETYYIYSLAWDEEHQVLYVAGRMASHGILKYHETTDTWETLGAGVSGTIDKIAWNEHDNYLYVFGDFITAGGKPSDGIAKWEEDSDEWSIFGEGAELRIYDLVWDSYQSRLYLGGDFTIENTYLPLIWWDELTDSWGWFSNNPRGTVLSIGYEPSETNDGEFWVVGPFEVAGEAVAHQLTRRLLTPLPTPTVTPTLPPTFTPGPTHTPTATLPPTSTPSATPTSALTATATTTLVPTTTAAPLFLPLIQSNHHSN